MSKVVARIGDLIRMDAKKLEVGKNGMLKLLILRNGIRIVESDNQLSLMSFMSKVVVEDSCFCMADVKVPA